MQKPYIITNQRVDWFNVQRVEDMGDHYVVTGTAVDSREPVIFSLPSWWALSCSLQSLRGYIALIHNSECLGVHTIQRATDDIPF